MGACCFPCLQQRIHDSPRFFYVVAPYEQGGVTLQCVLQQTFVGVSDGMIRECVLLVELHILGAHGHPLTGYLHLEPEMRTFIGLQTHGE